MLFGDHRCVRCFHRLYNIVLSLIKITTTRTTTKNKKIQKKKHFANFSHPKKGLKYYKTFITSITPKFYVLALNGMFKNSSIKSGRLFNAFQYKFSFDRLLAREFLCIIIMLLLLLLLLSCPSIAHKIVDN